MARILLTEDDSSVRTFVARALMLDRHEVTEAGDGLEAVEILEEEAASFDLLLSDIKMPGMDGIELAHAAHSRFPELRILLMTGYADQRERAENLEAVIEDVIQKPFTLSVIRDAVSSTLKKAA